MNKESIPKRSFDISGELLNRLATLAESTGKPATWIVRQALAEYLKAHEQPTPATPTTPPLEAITSPTGPELTLSFDGASRGNPGPAAIGVVITDASSNAVYELGARLDGDRTNNDAEYSAIIRGLQTAVAFGVGTLHVVGDSALVINQLRPVKPWNVKSDDLRPLHGEAMQILGTIPGYDLRHTRRADNGRADALGNMALDRGRTVEPMGTLTECVSKFLGVSSNGSAPEVSTTTVEP